MQSFRIALAAGFLAVAMAGNACASVGLVNNTMGNVTNSTGSGVGPYWLGQEFNIAGPAGSTNSNLAFNFYATVNPGNVAITPEAAGTLYLLTQAYTGTPAGLSTSTPGEIATATASGGVWTFATGLSISSNTNYWVYSDTSFQTYAANGLFTPAAGALTGYNAQTANTNNFAVQSTALTPLFLLNGTQMTAAVPEPSFVAMSALVCVGLGIARFRKKTVKTA
jgi:hypothetical protein